MEPVSDRTARERLRTLAATWAGQMLRPMPWGAGIALFFVILATIGVGVSVVDTTRAREHQKTLTELRVVKETCERSRTFGPPLVAFLVDVEGKLHTGDLERLVPLDGKKRPVITYYKATIPSSCPSK